MKSRECSSKTHFLGCFAVPPEDVGCMLVDAELCHPHKPSERCIPPWECIPSLGTGRCTSPVQAVWSGRRARTIAHGPGPPLPASVVPNTTVRWVPPKWVRSAWEKLREGRGVLKWITALRGWRWNLFQPLFQLNLSQHLIWVSCENN